MQSLEQGVQKNKAKSNKKKKKSETSLSQKRPTHARLLYNIDVNFCVPSVLPFFLQRSTNTSSYVWLFYVGDERDIHYFIGHISTYWEVLHIKISVEILVLKNFILQRNLI